MDVDALTVLHHAQEKEGCTVVMGKRGPLVFDCSGLVCWALKQAGGPDWRYTQNAQGLAELLQPIQNVPAGSVGLAFYGLDWEHVMHTMFVCPDGRAFGACGATHSVTTVDRAIELGARVRYWPSPGYRHDLLGFRALKLRFLHAVPGEPNA